MRIVFLSRYQNSIHRGAENFVEELSKRLSKKYTVDVLAGDEADSVSKIISGKYDIVIPINGRLQSFKVSLARVFGRYKILITGHSGKGWDDIWNIVVGKPDVFVVLTDYLANWAKGWAWGTKVIKISNGVDLNNFSPEGEKIKINLPTPIILSVGALVWYKHHEQVIKTVSELGKGSVLIVGEGEEKENLEKLGKELLGDRFKITVYNYVDMPKVYRSVDLFTLPSWDREAFGIVYLEALASGLGVVAPNDLSRKEIVGDAGILVNVDEVSLYSQALLKALSIEWSKKARAQAEKFSWEIIAKRYEDVMKGLIND